MARARKSKSKSKRGSNPRSRAARRAARAEAKAKRQLILIGGGLLALVLILGAFTALQGEEGGEVVTEERLSDDPVRGPSVAPVTIMEFGDFGCPSCRQWHNLGIAEQIRAVYGDQVRFVWRDFPVITAQSPKAAEAGQCAHDQGQFWEFHDRVYENFTGLSTSALVEHATAVGLDMETFEACLDSGQHEATVDFDMREALSLRLRGTPSFFVNEQPVIGPPTFEFLQSTIDSILRGG